MPCRRVIHSLTRACIGVQGASPLPCRKDYVRIITGTVGQWLALGTKSEAFHFPASLQRCWGLKWLFFQKLIVRATQSRKGLNRKRRKVETLDRLDLLRAKPSSRPAPRSALGCETLPASGKLQLRRTKRSKARAPKKPRFKPAGSFSLASIGD